MSVVIPARNFLAGGSVFGDRSLVDADRDGFRNAMRSLASGVSLVTIASNSGRNGMTATSVTSLAAEPPSLIVCINRTASLYADLAPSVAFGVNLLRVDQQDIADRFAGRTGDKGAARFEGAPWFAGPSGAPLLQSALAAFECEVEDIVERHTHAIVIAAVRRIAARSDGNALVYWRGHYESLGWAEEEVARATGRTPAAE